MSQRICAYIPPDAFIEGHGYRVSIVHEHEAGHCPTGDWPYNSQPGERLPWFWGMTYDEAKSHADAYNARMGIDREDALNIVTSSMREHAEAR